MRITIALLLFALALVLAVFELSPQGFTWIDHTGPLGSLDQWAAHVTGLIVLVLLITTGINVLRRRIASDEVDVEPDWGPSGGHDPGFYDPSDSFHE